MKRQKNIRLVPKWIYINYDEREGLYYLGGGIVFVIILFTVLENVITPKSEDFSHYDSLFVTVNSEKDLNEKESKPGELFHFDPNTLSVDSLQLLDLPENVIRNLQSYISSGGRIKSREGLRKIYGITEEDYNRLAPFIRISSDNEIKKTGIEKQVHHHVNTETGEAVETENTPNEIPIKPSTYPEENRGYLSKEYRTQDKDQDVNGSSEYTPYKTSKNKKVDLNHADEAVLQYVKGIGPTFSKRIIKYRELLGGFHHIGQLQEVYGMDIDLFLLIKDQVEISNHTRKLNLNTDNYRELVHPYISPQEAKVIVAYREQHGDYQSVYDLLHIHILDNYFIERILPYIPPEMITVDN